MALAKFQASVNTARMILSKIEKDAAWAWAKDLGEALSKAKDDLEADVPAIFLKLSTTEVLQKTKIGLHARSWVCGSGFHVGSVSGMLFVIFCFGRYLMEL